MASTRGRSSGTPPASQLRARFAQRSSSAGSVSGAAFLLGALQAGVDEVRRHIGKLRIVIRVGIDYGNAVLAQQRRELGNEKTLVPYLDDMLQRPPAGFAGQEPEEAVEIRRVELLEGSELPEHRSELVAKLEDAALEEPLDRLARLGKIAPVDHCPVALDREDEIRPASRRATS